MVKVEKRKKGTGNPYYKFQVTVNPAPKRWFTYYTNDGNTFFHHDDKITVNIKDIYKIALTSDLSKVEYVKGDISKLNKFISENK